MITVCYQDVTDRNVVKGVCYVFEVLQDVQSFTRCQVRY